MILRLLLVTLEEEDNLRIYDSIFWLSLIKCSYLPSPLPVLGNDGAGECRRLLHRIKMVLFREPLTCARSSFCWNHLSVPALLFVWITYICQICFFLQPFACVNTISFLKPLLVQFPILLDFCHLFYFRTFFIGNNPFLLAKHCNWEPMWLGGYKIDLKDCDKMWCKGGQFHLILDWLKLLE